MYTLCQCPTLLSLHFYRPIVTYHIIAHSSSRYITCEVHTDSVVMVNRFLDRRIVAGQLVDPFLLPFAYLEFNSQCSIDNYGTRDS